MFEKYFAFFGNAVDIDRRFDYLVKIYNHDRLFSFDAFARTVEYCADQMRSLGLTQVELLPLCADGKSAYGGFHLQRAWDARCGLLTDTSDGFLYADYERTPCSLMMYSAATPKDGITAQVVEVEEPEKADAELLRGKFLLTSREPGRVARLAVDAGAVGILSDYFPLVPGTRDSRDEMRGISRWDGSTLGGVNRDGTGLIGFSLSPENADRLRERIHERGSVTLHAYTDCTRYDGVKYTVSGLLPGTDPDAGELLIYGHLYEPGANDNASGCAVSLEIAACLTAAIKAGTLPRPKRSIRFAMGDECTGSAAFLESHPEIAERTVFGVVGDMIGCDITERTKSELWHAPLGNASLADTLISDIFAAYADKDPFPWSDMPFRSGSDNVIGEPSLGIPTVGYIISPALRYHTSGDTPETIDRNVLRRSCILLGTFLLKLAEALPSDLPYYQTLTARVSRNLEGALAQEVRNIAERSLARFLGGTFEPERVAYPEPAAYAASDSGIIPVRTTKGWFTLSGAPELAETYRKAFPFTLDKPISWTDGNRSLWQIYTLTAAECGTEMSEPLWKQFAAFYKDLCRCGYVTLR